MRFITIAWAILIISHLQLTSCSSPEDPAPRSPNSSGAMATPATPAAPSRPVGNGIGVNPFTLPTCLLESLGLNDLFYYDDKDKIIQRDVLDQGRMTFEYSENLVEVFKGSSTDKGDISARYKVDDDGKPLESTWHKHRNEVILTKFFYDNGRIVYCKAEDIADQPSNLYLDSVRYTYDVSSGNVIVMELYQKLAASNLGWEKYSTTNFSYDDKVNPTRGLLGFTMTFNTVPGMMSLNNYTFLSRIYEGSVLTSSISRQLTYNERSLPISSESQQNKRTISYLDCD